MSKALFAAVLAAALIAMPGLAPNAWAQTPAQTDAKPADAKPADAKPAPKASGGAAAMRERQRKCGAEWKAAKAAGKIEKGQKWPQFWSACNKRLKGTS